MASKTPPGVEPSRISAGSVAIYVGVSLVLFGIFAAAAGAGGSAGAGVAAGFLAALGGGLLSIGYFFRLFHMIERRLMDIEAKLTPTAPSAEDGPSQDAHFLG